MVKKTHHVFISPHPLRISRDFVLGRTKSENLLFLVPFCLDACAGTEPCDCSSPHKDLFATCQSFTPRSFFVLNKVRRRTAWRTCNYQKQNPSEQQFQVLHGLSSYQATCRLPPEAQGSDLYNALVTTLISYPLSPECHICIARCIISSLKMALFSMSK